MNGKKSLASLVLCCLVAASNGAVANTPDRNDISIIKIDGDIPAEQQSQSLEQLLAAGKWVVLQGDTDKLAAIRPDWIHLWPETETIVVSMHSGLGIYGMSDMRGLPDEALRDAVLGNISPPPMEARTRIAATPRPYLSTGPITENINTTIRPTGPVTVCQDFSNAVYRALFKSTTPTPAQRQAVAKEVARWCQYGKLTADYPAWGFDVTPFGRTWIPQKSFDIEWALIRNENLLAPERSTYLFWTKTSGEGAGSGFTRNNEDVAFWRDNVVRNLFDVGMHAGWGTSYPRDGRSWAQPGRGTGPGQHWPLADHRLFECDFGPAFTYSCPKGPRLLRLFPNDSFNNSVSVAVATALALGGTATLSGGADASGPNVSAALALSATYTETQTATAQVSLTDVQSTATRTYSRSTRWRPNVSAVWDWVKANRLHNGARIGNSTPLAATLNPSYDVLWEIPLRANTGRAFRYTIISEVGVNHCVRTACSGHKQPPDRNIPPQRRIGWSDSVLLWF